MSNAAILSELENAWRAIQKRHPEVPAVCLVLATGTKNGRYIKNGHWWVGQWSSGGRDFPEVLIAAERLRDGPHAVLTTLLHEAVHGLAHVRGIKDTSRQGRWHNGRFRELSEEVGLATAQDERLGCITPGMRAETTAEYAETLELLSEAMGSENAIFRKRPDPPKPKPKKPRRTYTVLTCPCDIPIRVIECTHPRIMCWECGHDFKRQRPSA